VLCFKLVGGVSRCVILQPRIDQIEVCAWAFGAEMHARETVDDDDALVTDDRADDFPKITCLLQICAARDRADFFV
jgi:hypothetical protein